MVDDVERDVFIDPGASDCTIKASIVLAEDLKMIRESVTF